MAPRDFWELSAGEFWLIYETRKPPEMVGKMRSDNFEALKALCHAKSG